MRRAKTEYSDNFSYLLQLLSSVLNDTKPEKPAVNTDWASVYSLAEYHSVTGMVYYALMKLAPEYLPDTELLNEFRNAYREQIIYEANLQVETDRLLGELDRLGVDVVPVKGFVLKNDYPEPSMRTMSDIDILYRQEYREEVIQLFKSSGYTLRHDIEGQLDFVKEPFYHYELHSKLLPSTKTSHAYFENIWDKVLTPPDTRVGSLSINDTYIYMLEHLAKHLEGGGAGLRLIMDVYVFLKAHSTELDSEYISQELTKLRLTKFCGIISELSKSWFGGGVPDTDSVAADYILCSCTFGTAENSLLQSAIREEKRTGKKRSGLSNVFRKVFPPYSFICSRFESAKNHRLLYPFYVFAYWFKRAFKDRNITTANLNYYMESSDSAKAEYIRKAMDVLGLDLRM
ncbi:MAG: nucleotidyltransferase family protein [Clostridia bacterium]|nr:nucleotidyltransferase family protein [Clostridia bacterium]